MTTAGAAQATNIPVRDVDDEVATLNGMMDMVTLRMDALEAAIDGRSDEMAQEIKALRLMVVRGEGSSEGGSVKSGQGRFVARLKDAEGFLPSAWSGEERSRPFEEFRHDVLNYMSVLYPSIDSEPILKWATRQKEEITDDWLDEHEEEYPGIREVNRALGASVDQMHHRHR